MSNRAARRSMGQRQFRRMIVEKRDQLIELRHHSPETIASVMGISVADVHELLGLLEADEAAATERAAS